MALCRVVLLAWLWISVRGEERISVSCVVMETCVLPCSFDDEEEAVELADWYKKEDGAVVHAWHRGAYVLQNQDAAFRGRTSMFPEQVSGGNASLKLSTVTVRDQGLYLCRVLSFSSEKDLWLDLKVEAPVEAVNMEWRGDVLVCSSEKIYPQPNISWLPDSEIQTKVEETENGLKSISSSLRLDPHPPQQFSCNISTYTSWKSATYRLQPPVQRSANISLPCVDSMVPEKSLVWTFNYVQTIVSRRGAEVTDAAPWRPFVEAVSESGSLSLKDLGEEQEGVYICELHTDHTTYFSRTVVEKPDRSAVTAAWVAVPLSLIIIIIISAVIVFLVRRHKKKKKLSPGRRDTVTPGEAERQSSEGQALVSRLPNGGAETDTFRRLLKSAFEELSGDELVKFRSLLSDQSLMTGFLIIPKHELRKEDLSKVMVEAYGPSSISVVRRALTRLQRNDLLDSMRGGLCDRRLSSWEGSALSSLLLPTDSTLAEFDLRKYDPTESSLLELLVVVEVSIKANLSGCNLTENVCTRLASVLSSSSLTQLDLSNNDLQDSAVELLCEGLKSAPCRLHTLSLSLCGLTEKACAPLASVLSSSSSLTQLDLSNNDLQDSGVKQLCEGLKSAPCRLHTLRLSGCMVTERGGASLATALNSASSSLTELDLSYNHPGSSRDLLTALQAPQGPLQTLRLDPAGERWIVPGLKKYACEIFLDPNTANKNLLLSEDNRSVVFVWEEQPYPDHEDRFTHWAQVLSSSGLRGRCYWEVDYVGRRFKEVVSIAVSYKGIERAGNSQQCVFGVGKGSWSLSPREDHYTVRHRGVQTLLSYPFSLRVAVLLDSEAGTLSFYQVLSDGALSHLHTFLTDFTEELFAGFEVGYNSKVTLVNMKS